MARFFGIWALVAATVSFAPTRAFADPPDEVSAESVPPARQPERTWLYVEEPQLPAPLHAVVGSRITYTTGGAPFAADLTAPGTLMEAGGELGLLPGLSVSASGVTSGSTTSSGAQTGALAGARLSLLPRTFQTTRAVASAGYIRELTGANGAWARLAVSQDFGLMRLATTVHGQHVYAARHDAVDMMAMVGANVRVTSFLRAGAEYVAQDLEASFDPEEAEGGTRHFLGPSASFALLDEKLTIAGGPAFGLSAISPRVLGRVAVAYSF
jgi:hypothetical protein